MGPKIARHRAGALAHLFWTRSCTYVGAAMTTIETKYFGPMTYDDASCFEFPWGLPAFESECRFLPIEMPGHQPLVFLQSVVTVSLCFIALPVLAADGEYELAVSAGDLRDLELDDQRQPAIGSEVLVLALLSIHDDGPATANLLAPVVINLANRWALQAIRGDTVYSYAQPIGSARKELAC